ncbi:MAG: CPBP family intramembrane metalloprotease [Candidatus Korarchaeota archaeon]|nr:CPBP family intramembrane metalloprotease [Candidatus Korarchaeota archaeon]
MKELYVLIWSYQSLFMIMIQASFGLALFTKTRVAYDLRREDVLLIASLILAAELLFFMENSIQPYGYEWFLDVISRIPAWAKYMNFLVAPFTAGIFEEIIWRGFGIESLRRFTSEVKAILIQAIAFALWHISPIHVIFVFFIGLAYGFAFVKRRSLAPLIIAHILTDLIGFSVFLLA